MRLAATGLAVQDDATPFGDEGRGERGAEQLQVQRRVEGEVELVDGLQEGKLSAARQPGNARLLTVSDLLGDEQGEQVVEGPLLGFGTHDQIVPDTPYPPLPARSPITCSKDPRTGALRQTTRSTSPG